LILKNLHLKQIGQQGVRPLLPYLLLHLST
jgi:hypothetical protein